VKVDSKTVDIIVDRGTPYVRSIPNDIKVMIRNLDTHMEDIYENTKSNTKTDRFGTTTNKT